LHQSDEYCDNTIGGGKLKPKSKQRWISDRPRTKKKKNREEAPATGHDTLNAKKQKGEYGPGGAVGSGSGSGNGSGNENGNGRSDEALGIGGKLLVVREPFCGGVCA
jgi:hypothetical protein